MVGRCDISPVPFYEDYFFNIFVGLLWPVLWFFPSPETNPYYRIFISFTDTYLHRAAHTHKKLYFDPSGTVPISTLCPFLRIVRMRTAEQVLERRLRVLGSPAERLPPLRELIWRRLRRRNGEDAEDSMELERERERNLHGDVWDRERNRHR